MASVCDEIRSEFKTKALKWCRKYLGGSWKNLSLDEFSIERLGYVCLLLRTVTSLALGRLGYLSVMQFSLSFPMLLLPFIYTATLWALCYKRIWYDLKKSLTLRHPRHWCEHKKAPEEIIIPSINGKDMCSSRSSYIYYFLWQAIVLMFQRAWVFEGALNVIVVTHGHLWDEYLWVRWVRRQENPTRRFLNLLDFGFSY